MSNDQQMYAPMDDEQRLQFIHEHMATPVPADRLPAARLAQMRENDVSGLSPKSGLLMLHEIAEKVDACDYPATVMVDIMMTVMTLSFNHDMLVRAHQIVMDNAPKGAQG